MRVVAGTARGRRLRAPRGSALRPTSDFVREAVFNMLASRDLVEDAAVVDLFAGTGALGIEALSRGARAVTFVDDDRAAIGAVRANLEATGLAGEPAMVVQADVVRWLAGAPAFDLALADPPYAFDRWDQVLATLRARLLVAESDREVAGDHGWDVHDVRQYGSTVVTLLTPPGETSPT